MDIIKYENKEKEKELWGDRHWLEIDHKEISEIGIQAVWAKKWRR